MTLLKNTLTLSLVALSLLSSGYVTAETASDGADGIIRAEKLHPSANRSYKVAGKRYTPMTKISAFSQTGKASWYGGQFHGRKTSSGERYDMNAMTAAHKTLPIPSYVRVTNTQNGKSVVVRVNDRGPFHGSRVIDLSKAAAQKLGFVHQGTADVRVEQIVPNRKSNTTEPKNRYVDLKSFSNESDARAYMLQTEQRLAGVYQTSKVSLDNKDGKYTVRLGPFDTQSGVDKAESLENTEI